MTAGDIYHGRRGGHALPGAAKHVCHATGCTVSVPPRLLMCARHWRMVPLELQAAVWATYEPGQEHRKDPTGDYLDAALAAVAAVAERERRKVRRPDQPGLF